MEKQFIVRFHMPEGVTTKQMALLISAAVGNMIQDVAKTQNMRHVETKLYLPGIKK